jgi:hypothetical protein
VRQEVVHKEMIDFVIVNGLIINVLVVYIQIMWISVDFCGILFLAWLALCNSLKLRFFHPHLFRTLQPLASEEFEEKK